MQIHRITYIIHWFGYFVPYSLSNEISRYSVKILCKLTWGLSFSNEPKFCFLSFCFCSSVSMNPLICSNLYISTCCKVCISCPVFCSNALTEDSQLWNLSSKIMSHHYTKFWFCAYYLPGEISYLLVHLNILSDSDC